VSRAYRNSPPLLQTIGSAFAQVFPRDPTERGDHDVFVERDGGCGHLVNHSTTEVKIRRVDREDGQAVQIEIVLDDYYRSGKSRTMHGSLSLTQEAVDAMIRALRGEVKS